MLGDNPLTWSFSLWQTLKLTSGHLKPRYNLGVSLLTDGKILVIGGDSVNKVSHEILIFDPKERTMSQIAQSNKKKIIPAYYPCVLTQRNLVVTINDDTSELTTFDTRQNKVRAYDPIYLLNDAWQK